MSPADANFVRVQVLLTPKEAERFNAYCARNGFKKSTLIAKLVREYLDRETVRRARKARLAAPSPRSSRKRSARPSAAPHAGNRFPRRIRNETESAALPSRLAPLVETARAYARAATSKNTNRAYAADWRDYLGWRARQGLEARPLADAADRRPLCRRPRLRQAAAALRRHHRAPAVGAGLEFRAGAALAFDRRDRHVATVLAGIRRTHGRPPAQKEALLPEHILAMLDALPPATLRNLRDRAILLIGFAGGLRRSEIVGLDCRPEDSLDGAGWPEFLEGGLLLTLRGKTGWREVEIGRGSTDATCPVVALETWMNFARIAHGPLFRRVAAARIGIGTAQRPPCRSPGQARRHGCRDARRPARGRAGGESSPGILCAPASPPRPRSTSAMCKSSSATPPPK